jgi:hypothetical protein
MADSKANVLVVFYSRDGSVEALAKAVGEGAREAGAEVRLRRVPDLVSPAVMAHVPGWEERSKRMLGEYGTPTPADTEWADGIIFGTPTRFGNPARVADLIALLDDFEAGFGRSAARERRVKFRRASQVKTLKVILETLNDANTPVRERSATTRTEASARYCRLNERPSGRRPPA